MEPKMISFSNCCTQIRLKKLNLSRDQSNVWGCTLKTLTETNSSNEIISQKLLSFFNKADFRLKLIQKQSFLHWKHQIELNEHTKRLSTELKQVQSELQIEKEERMQYQQKLQARNIASKSKPPMASLQKHKQQSDQGNMFSPNPAKVYQTQSKMIQKNIRETLNFYNGSANDDLTSNNMSKTEFDPLGFTNDKGSATSALYSNTPLSERQPGPVSQFKANEDLHIVQGEEEFSSQNLQTACSNSEDKLKFMLEKFIKDNQDQQNLKLYQQREIQHLVNYVQKVQTESEECTFHPNINPKTQVILQQNPLYQLRSLNNSPTRDELFKRLHKEAHVKKANLIKFDEMRERKQMEECTFSPKTNSPNTHKSPDAFKRLHYSETEHRQEKMLQKEQDKLQKQKEECPFKPERSKTRKYDSRLHNKENDESHFERLYRVSKEQEQKLKEKRQAALQQEQFMRNNPRKSKSRSKSHKKQPFDSFSQNMQSIAFTSFSPSSLTMSRQTQDIHQTLSPPSMQKKHHQLSTNYLSQTVQYNQPIPSLKQTKSQNTFHRLYSNAQESQTRKQKLIKELDQELGISFSPQLFKSPKRIAESKSPQLSVIERNEQFQINKILKIQEKEEMKYQECTFEPQLISKRKTFQIDNESISDVGERLYQNAIKQEEKKARKKLEMESKLKQQYLKTRK